MCPSRADECFVPGGTLAVGSNAELRKPAFAGAGSRPEQEQDGDPDH